MLSHWHPVLRSQDLPRDRAVAVKIAGNEMALFRIGDGRIGAVEDRCVHRRMRLSLGKVRDGRVVCPYHGWSYCADGQGESPSTPRMHACITSFECAEAYGSIWIKDRSTPQDLPKLEMEGWDFVGPAVHHAQAPLQLLIDNMSEIEHTVSTHRHFGFDPARTNEAVLEYEADDDSVMVRSHGPAKMPPVLTRLTAWVRPGDRFHSNYTFHFDPPRTAVTHFWVDPRTGRERLAQYHVRVYFVPVDERQTTIVSFAFLKLRKRPVIRRLGTLTRWFIRQRVRETIEEDIFLVENLADQSTAMDGMKLGRFDAILGMTRERLDRIYYRNGVSAAD